MTRRDVFLALLLASLPSLPAQNADTYSRKPKPPETPAPKEPAAPGPMKIGSHHMGETINEWNALEFSSNKRGESMITEAEDRIFEWSFHDGRLAEIKVTPYPPDLFGGKSKPIPKFDEEIRLLTSVYGKPTHVDAVAYQNGFGARWERGEAHWSMPDGTSIDAYEATQFDQGGRLLLVLFIATDGYASPVNKPNPYAPK